MFVVGLAVEAGDMQKVVGRGIAVVEGLIADIVEGTRTAVGCIDQVDAAGVVAEHIAGKETMGRPVSDLSRNKNVVAGGFECVVEGEHIARLMHSKSSNSRRLLVHD